jgi:DNA-binding CsgD family transcriptional regulator
VRAGRACGGGARAGPRRHARARVERDGSQLQAAADRFDALGALGLAAEAADAAADAFAVAGRARQAAAMARRAGELRSRCGAGRPIGGAAGASSALTRREREISGLAATGMSSKAIAGRLGVSVRTVDNHLQHAYTKMGVTSRDGLRAALAADE